MSTNGSPSNGVKKRKQECSRIDHEGQAALKSVKLEKNSPGRAGSEEQESVCVSEGDSQDESLSRVSTSQESNSSPAPSAASLASRNLNDGAPALLPSTSQQQGFLQPGIHAQQNPRILELHSGTTFEKLLSSFAVSSTDQLPNKITYNGSGYDLHKAFEEFWSAFYNSSEHTTGSFTKLPKLGLHESQAISRIFRRGWEDCHYFPNRIFQPFLEVCIFNREKFNLVKVSENMLFEYITPLDKELIQNSPSVTEEISEVFSKYCPLMSKNVTLGMTISNACTKVVLNMLNDLRDLIEIWTAELAGLLEFNEFKFIMQRPNIEDDVEMHQINREKAPHKRWCTFFYNWSQEQIDYYFRTLKNDILSSRCNFCLSSGNMDAHHFLGVCTVSMETLLKDRHDCVLRKIHQKLKSAIEKKRPYFLEGVWKTIVMYGNCRYKWPKDLKMLGDVRKFPHIIVYTMTPTKKALIIEISIAWEDYIARRKEEKTRDHLRVKEKFEKCGFEVQLEIIVLGSRGAPTEDLYSLFEQVFGMSQSNTSRAMEKICKKIVSVPFFYNIAT